MSDQAGKFVAEVTWGIPACWTCRHKQPGPTCTAFPEGIPEPILNGEHRHREEFPGDGGIRYEPID